MKLCHRRATTHFELYEVPSDGTVILYVNPISAARRKMKTTHIVSLEPRTPEHPRGAGDPGAYLAAGRPRTVAAAGELRP